MSFPTDFGRIFASRRRTFLGAGPMSVRVTDAIVELANFYKKPIAVIPSRRQVDAAHLGGGYVNQWSTEEFTRYVRVRDKGQFVKLSRDHSGPWQLKTHDDLGVAFSHGDAMAEVMESLEVDIRCGFDLIHIDPSRGLEFGRSQSQVEDDVLELLEFCQTRQTRPIMYEVGADEQSQIPDQVHVAEASLVRVLNRVKQTGLQAPMFYVLQTGTKVMELRNIGSFDSELPVASMLPASVQLPDILKMCRRNGVFLKEHNADYLSDGAVDWHRRYGIHAANVAPEFGVAETRAALAIAKDTGADFFVERFSDHTLKGEMWSKWLLPNSKATDAEKVLMAGHYHFSDEVGRELLSSLEIHVNQKGVDFDAYVRSAVRTSIDRYLRGFGYAL